MVDAKKHYNNFGEDEKKKIEDTIVWSMNKYSKALLELQGLILDSLYNKLETRWKTAINKNKELIELVLMHLQPETSREDIQEIIYKYRPLFITKKRLTRLLVGESQSVHAETEKILKKFLGLISKEEPKNIDYSDEDDIPKAPIFEGEPPKINTNDVIEVNDTPVDTENEPEIHTVTKEQTVLLEATSTGIGEEKTKVEKKNEEKTYEEMNETLVITQENVQTSEQPKKDRRLRATGKGDRRTKD